MGTDGNNGNNGNKSSGFRLPKWIVWLIIICLFVLVGLLIWYFFPVTPEPTKKQASVDPNARKTGVTSKNPKNTASKPPFSTAPTSGNPTVPGNTQPVPGNTAPNTPGASALPENTVPTTPYVPPPPAPPVPPPPPPPPPPEPEPEWYSEPEPEPERDLCEMYGGAYCYADGL